MQNPYSKESEDEKWKSYFYPGTTTFINKLGITDDKELNIVERQLCDQKVEELKKNPIEGCFDIKHLCDIHRYLFGDLYEWAGEYRNVYMMKPDGSYFAPIEKIEFYLQDSINIMHRGMSEVYNKDTLANFITDCYVALINVHPFREGNGRAIREFLREFVIKKTDLIWGEAYDINWSVVNSELINELMPFGRAYYGSIKMEILKAITPKMVK